jgi:CRP/FNR family transcriptional regulator, cyclic AMP receptor protein
MESTQDLLVAHPFLEGVPHHEVDRLASYASRHAFPAGRTVFRAGGRADRFWLIRSGRISLELGVDGRGDVAIEQLGPGQLLGWSWILPPHQWRFSAVAAEPTLTIEVNAAGVRELCEQDPAFGRAITQRVAAVLAERLEATRVRLLELYAYQGRKESDHPSEPVEEGTLSA